MSLSGQLSNLRMSLSAMRTADELAPLQPDTRLELIGVELSLVGLVQQVSALEAKLVKLQEWEACYDDT